MGLEDHDADARPATLEEETRTVIEEARMVLPGIQAFFGFQLIAVFNSRFQDLTHTEQVLHLVALLMLAVSIGLIMTPAAYHRIAVRGMVSRHFIELASRFLESAMFPLMLSITNRYFSVKSIYLGQCGVRRRHRSGYGSHVLWSGYVFPWTQAARTKNRRGSGSRIAG